MKKFTFKAVATFLMVVTFSNLFAQVKPAVEGPSINRCGTMEALKDMLKQDPTLAAKWKADGDKLYAASQKNNGTNSPNKVEAITYIPVVFHVILTAAQHATVTDALIQRQLDVLNRDYAGVNPDSTNGGAFIPNRGHSEIRFVLAKRTPGGVATNGIERLTSAQTFTQATYNTIMKHTAAGGLDQWDGNKYFNVWVGTFTDGLLGIATFPNTGNANEQGVCIHWGSVDLPCGSPFAGAFDGGRTLVHEAGHYFYLFHIWGDDGTACTGNDFGTPYGALPASCTDDTPNQAGPTSGCFTGVHTDACSPAAPGIQYQNYMDYTDDPCYSMFTNNQICRAQGCLDAFRASLKTSDGATPLAPVNNDARISEVLNPKSRGFACGATTTYCDAFTPTALLFNNGDNALTTVAIDCKVNGVTVNTTNWTGNLAPGAFAYVPLSAVNSPGGPHILTVKSRLPNGAADPVTANDSVNARFSQTGAAGASLPINEGFESATFPPTTPAPGWSITNPDGGITWTRSTAAAKTGVASAFVNHYAYTAQGQIDYLVSPKFNTAGADVINIDFDMAYAPFSATLFERLEVVYSTDCGVTWTNAGFDKSGLTLATVPAPVTGVFTPTAAQWRHETVQLLVGCGTPLPALTVAFKTTNGYGNQLYIDNVAITATAGAANNLQANTLTNVPDIICPTVGLNGEVTPVFSFRNLGTNSPLTTAKYNVMIDGVLQVTPVIPNFNGSLAKCATSTPVSLGTFTVNGGGGNHVLKVYTTLPNNLADGVPSNDTLTKNFYVVPALTVPSTEGFESATFPPAGGWAVVNPDGGITWARSTAAAKTGVASAYMNFYAYPTTGQIDLLKTPIIPLTTYDTVGVAFDYAYAPFSATLTDTMEVQASSDCGVTWTTIWKFGGLQLATAPAATGVFVPTAAQWRNVALKFPTCNYSGKTLMFAMKATNGYGNQFYLDNFAVSGALSYARNAGVVNIIDPPPALCVTNFTPKVTISNLGATPLTAVTINYQVDGGPVATFNYTNASGLPRCSTAVVTLNPVTSTAGNHVLTVYTTNPNGASDLYTANDTARKAFSISPTVSTPQVEGFEGVTFPPTNWSVQNPDGLVTWTRNTTAGAARTGTGAMVIQNFNQATAATEDKFYSPVIANSPTIDSMFVSFDYAYLQGAQYPGSTVFPLDTLEVMITKDCGQTFTTIWKKWGADLQSVNEPNYNYLTGYVPQSAGEYKNVKIFLTPYVGNSNYQVYWVAKSNKQNNLWMDNINIFSKTVPSKVKNQGVAIYPNPFGSSFRIHHWVAPIDLQAAQVYDAAGKLVWDKRFNGDATTEINVNLSRLAAGTYVLRMVYSNKVIVERIVKTN